jgi:hypothetical protein
VTPYFETLTRSAVLRLQLVELLGRAAELLSDHPPTVTPGVRSDICNELYQIAAALCEHDEIDERDICEACHARVYRADRRLDG